MTRENAPTDAQAADTLDLFEQARIALRRAFERRDGSSEQEQAGHAVGSTLRAT